MRSSFKTAVVSLCLLASISPVALAAQDADEYDEITSQMEDIRQLELAEPLDISVRTRAELQQEYEDSLDTDFPPDERDATNRVLIAFGLMEPGQDIGELQVGLLSEQVAGYYDPSTGEMVVVVSDDQEELSAADKVTFAHEVVHALQDQNFDLTSFDDQRLDGTSDESLAITALVEGDATLGMLDYLLSNPEVARDYLAEMGSSDLSTDQLDNAPPILSASLTFPYEYGQVFVQTLYDDGGWDAVDEAFANPPTTTEQIMHPEKYEDGEDAVAVELPDVAALLGAGWEALDVDTMGEFQVSVMLDDSDLSDQQVEEAAAGWGGDSYTVAASGDDVVVAWQSTWDSDDDAEQFAKALAVRESARFDGDTSAEGETVTIESDEAVVQIVIDGDTVTYLQAPDAATLEAVDEAID